MPEIENTEDLFEEEEGKEPVSTDDSQEDLFEDDEPAEEPKAAPKAPAPHPQDQEKLSKAIERKSVALDRERQRRKEVEAELARFKGTSSEQQAAPAQVVDAEAIARKVREELTREESIRKDKEYEDTLKAQIRELPNMTKELAKEILTMAKSVPSRANPSSSVSFAYNWVMQNHNPNFSTTPAPISSWSGTSSHRTSSNGPTEGQKALGQAMGMSPEEVEKFHGSTPSIFKR